MNISSLLLVFNLLTASFICKADYSPELIKVSLDEQTIDANCYTAILPKERNINSYLILIPGFGETAEDVINATDLPYKATEAGIAVFIPILQNGVESYSFSAESQNNLHKIATDIKTKFKLTNKDYSIGGFSMGGSAAIRYAELNIDNPPTSVFAIDSPLDYERFRYSTERDVKIYKKGIADGDSIYVKLLNDITPLVKDSPYLISDTTHNAILPLKNIPIRYYIEPAEQWWLDNRKTDVIGLNIIDGTAFINDLRLIGNNNAELIITHKKGYRNNGKTYHPHSWTIANTDELIKWIKGCHDNSNCKCHNQ